MKSGPVSDVGALGDCFRQVLVSGETEIKFAIDKGRKPTVMEGIGESAQERSTYETIYFDTDNSNLRRHQLELGVRNQR